MFIAPNSNNDNDLEEGAQTKISRYGIDEASNIF